MSAAALRIREDATSPLSQTTRWLAVATAATSLVALPVGMTIANKSAPLFFVLSAVLANAGALSAVSAKQLRHRYRLVLGTGLAGLTFATVALAVASFAWTIDRGATSRGLVEALPEFVAAGCLAAAWPVLVQRRHLALLKYGLLAALIVVIFEALAGMPIHHLVGARAEDYDLKRSVVPVVLLLWPCAAIGTRRYRVGWTVGLWMAALLAAIVAHSSASVAALVLASAIYIAARLLPQPTLWIGAATAVLLLAVAPWMGVLTKHVLQPEGVALLAQQHAEGRVGLWSNFGHHALQRPLLGHGFDASLMIAGSLKLDHAQDVAMDWNVHPHSILLQVWVEFGLVGVALALGGIVFCLSCLARLTDRERAFRLAFAGSAATVALVGLNAWAPWWLAVMSLALVLFFIQRTMAEQSDDASPVAAA